MKFFIKLFVILWITAGPGLAEERGTISVTGSGVVETAPDMATISLGVSSEARTAALALAANSAATSEVLKQVKVAGIADRDAQTSGLSLSPIWNRQSSSNTRPTITGYSAFNQVTIRVRDLPALGGILDDVAKSGANQFNGLRFGVQDPGPPTDQARKLAVKDALRKAALFAEAAGVRLGRIMELSEHGGSAPRPLLARDMAMSEAVPIAEGEVAIQASVSVVFEIAD